MTSIGFFIYVQYYQFILEEVPASTRVTLAEIQSAVEHMSYIDFF